MIRHGDDEGGLAAHLGEQFAAAEIDHEVLRVGGERERDAELLEEQRGVGRAVGEVDMHVGHAARLEQPGEVERVARTQFRLVGLAVGPVVGGDEIGERLPGPVGLGKFLHRLEDLRRWRVVGIGPDVGQALVAKAVGRGVERADAEGHASRLEREHLGVAEGLRGDRVAREKVGNLGLGWHRSINHSVRRTHSLPSPRRGFSGD